MTIKINCPVCRANNELKPSDLQCRRCREDLSLLYAIKGYSFKYRYYAVQMLVNKAEPKLTSTMIQAAQQLDKT
jgi:transposase-like protein